MTELQKVIKYLAMAFAVFLTVAIIGGILSAAGILGSLFSGGDADQSDVVGDTKTYSLTSGISQLDIQINAADFYIREGSSFSVESNLKNLSVEEKSGRLTIKDLTKIKFNGTSVYEDALLTVYVPTGTVFENVRIETGAGRLTVHALSAETVDFELGAGDVSIDSLVATRSAAIQGGAGRITVGSGALRDLALEMGVGQLNLTSALTGDCRLELGVGQSNITLIGTGDDYDLEIQKGIGNISVDGKNFTDYNSAGNGENKVELNGGIGAIHVTFQTSETG